MSEQNKRPENRDPKRSPAPKKPIVKKKAATPKKEEKTKKKRPWWIWVFLLLIILIIALVAGYFSGYFVGKVVHEQTEQTTEAASKESTETASEEESSSVSQQDATDEPKDEMVDSNSTANTSDGDIPVENVTELQPVMYKSSPRSDKIPVPSFIIAYSANADKIQANRNFSHLESLGFESGIYWIPDFFSAGKPLYKVYVGPFTTRSDAETRLIAVRKLQADAYVMKVE